MDVTSSTSGLYSQYRSLVDGLRGRSAAVAPQEDIEAANEKVAGSSRQAAAYKNPWAGSAGPIDTASVQLDQTTQIQAQEAAQPVGKKDEYIDPHIKRAARDEINRTAFDFLYSYANDHLDKWAAEANNQHVAAMGWGFTDHFFAQPSGATIDFAAGLPNSQAESIFRKIADPEDIAKLDEIIAPGIEKARGQIKDALLDLIGTAAAGLNEYAPAAPKFEAAGITYADMRNVKIERTADGQFAIKRSSSLVSDEKAQTIEQVINQDPAVRAIFEARVANGHPPPATEITAEAATDPDSIYGQYQSLLDRVKAGTTSAMQAVSEHRELFRTAAGLILRV